MHIRRKISWLVLPVAVALLAAGCGGGSGSGAADSDGEIKVSGTDPENPLIPANTTEVGGGYPVEDMFSLLVSYSPKDFSPSNLMAESITTEDNKTFDIKIKKGWKFHNGEEVTADNFVKAWNYSVSNGLANSSFLEKIKGYKESLPAEVPEGESPKPTNKDLSGLKTVNDYEFTVTLSGPFKLFPTMLGYSAFAPMPDMFFSDREAYEKKPVGNGPMKFVEYRPNTFIKLTRYDDYKGKDKVKFKDLTYQIYQDPNAAYQDLLAGELDFMDELPDSALAGNAYQTDLEDRVVKADLLKTTTISFPLYAKDMDNADFHKAISMAINREQISQEVFQGTTIPMTGWVPEYMPGAEAGACGEFCTYNPQKAKEYLKRSGFKQKSITISSNTDGANREWIQAVCGNIENALGLKCNLTPYTSFGAFREKIEGKEMTGLFRTGWVADYPAIENFLDPLYSSNGSSNDNDYANDQFDQLLDKAGAAETTEEANRLYLEAEKLLADDMSAIPLWTDEGIAGQSENVSNVRMTPKQRLDITSITANSDS